MIINVYRLLIIAYIKASLSKKNYKIIIKCKFLLQKLECFVIVSMLRLHRMIF